jgi:hypothetical protein
MKGKTIRIKKKLKQVGEKKIKHEVNQSIKEKKNIQVGKKKIKLNKSINPSIKGK